MDGRKGEELVDGVMLFDVRSGQYILYTFITYNIKIYILYLCLSFHKLKLEDEESKPKASCKLTKGVYFFLFICPHD